MLHLSPGALIRSPAKNNKQDSYRYHNQKRCAMKKVFVPYYPLNHLIPPNL
jgi:hypothetical protein